MFEPKNMKINQSKSIKINGIVVKGRQEGRKIGFPTANIDPKFYTPPLQKTQHGIYATRTYYDGKIYNSITNYGTAPAYNFDKVIFETYIFDFDQDLYDRRIEVEVVEFIRPVMNFGTIDSLVIQIKKDCQQAHKILRK